MDAWIHASGTARNLLPALRRGLDPCGWQGPKSLSHHGHLSRLESAAEPKLAPRDSHDRQWSSQPLPPCPRDLGLDRHTGISLGSWTGSTAPKRRGSTSLLAG